MRKLSIAFLILVVVLGAAFALAFRNLDAYLTQNRDRVAAQVAQKLGREVTFDSVGISWAGGFGVRVDGLRVGDDPNFSKEDFLTAEVVDVRVKLLPALFGRVEVGRVVLRAPRVFVTRTKQGFSLDSLGDGATGAPGGASAGGAGEAGAPPPAALAIALLDVRDGALRFVDRRVSPPVTFEVEQLDVQASELGLGDPVSFELAAALFGAKSRNLSLTGSVGPLAAEDPRVDLDFELAPVDLEQALRVQAVRDLLPQALSGSGPVRLEAKLAGALTDLEFSAEVDADAAAVKFGGAVDKPPGVRLDLTLAGSKRGDRVEIPKLRVVLGDTDVSGSAQLALGTPSQLKFQLAADPLAPAAFGAGGEQDVLRDVTLVGDLALAAAGPRGSVTVRSPNGRLRDAEYRNLVAELKPRGEQTRIERVSADAFDGKLELSGNYETRGSAPPRFDLATRLAGMRIEQIVQAAAGRESRLLKGVVDLRLDVDGSGSGWEQIRDALRGNGTLHLREGVLQDFNPAGDALRALTLVPAIGGNGIAQVLARHPRVLGEGDTPIDDLTSDFTIEQGWLQVRELVVRTEEYNLKGAGRYSLAGALDFKTALTFNPTLSQELLVAAPDLRYVRDVEGQVAIPVALRGTPPKVAVVPDVSKLAGNAAREALTDALGKAIGVKQQPAEDGAAPSATQPGGILGGILDEALRGKRSPQAPVGVPAPQAPSPPAPQEPAPPEAEPPPPPPEDAANELLQRGLEGLLGGGQQQ